MNPPQSKSSWNSGRCASCCRPRAIYHADRFLKSKTSGRRRMEIQPAAFPCIQQRTGTNVAPQVAQSPMGRFWGGWGRRSRRGDLSADLPSFSQTGQQHFSSSQNTNHAAQEPKTMDRTAAFKRYTVGFSPWRCCSSITTRFTLFKHPGRIRHISVVQTATWCGPSLLPTIPGWCYIIFKHQWRLNIFFQ